MSRRSALWRLIWVKVLTDARAARAVVAVVTGTSPLSLPGAVAVKIYARATDGLPASTTTGLGRLTSTGRGERN